MPRVLPDPGLRITKIGQTGLLPHRLGSDQRTKMRMHQAGLLAEARAHQVVGLFVIGDGGAHAADKRQMIHLPGYER